MQVKPKVGSIIIYVHSYLSYLFTFNFHTIYVLPRLSIHSYPDYRHTQKERHKMNLLIATTAAFALLISTVSAGAVRVYFFFFYISFPFPTKSYNHTYLTNLIIIVTNFLLLQSCTKPFGSGYCHDDQTGDMLRCSTVCIHFSCPSLIPTLPYFTCSTLLYSIDGVCVLWILQFSSPPFFAYVEDKIIRKFSNGILIMKFVFCFLICF